uniref:Secreted protein n=1 Tax=Arundo donax TaxID=35708 RepID=A0A0A9AMV4_ARUDO
MLHFISFILSFLGCFSLKDYRIYGAILILKSMSVPCLPNKPKDLAHKVYIFGIMKTVEDFIQNIRAGVSETICFNTKRRSELHGSCKSAMK